LPGIHPFDSFDLPICRLLRIMKLIAGRLTWHPLHSAPPRHVPQSQAARRMLMSA